jgi:hypothetical protein
MKALQTLLMRCAALALLAACPPVLFSGCGSEGTTQPDGRDAPEEVSDGSDAAEEEIVQEDADILAEAADSIDDDPVSEETVHPACDPMTDHGCIMVRIGEREFLRTIADYETLEFNDEGTTRTVIHLWQLVDEEITTQPDQQRYKIYGTGTRSAITFTGKISLEGTSRSAREGSCTNRPWSCRGSSGSRTPT